MRIRSLPTFTLVSAASLLFTLTHPTSADTHAEQILATGEILESYVVQETQTDSLLGIASPSFYFVVELEERIYYCVVWYDHVSNTTHRMANTNCYNSSLHPN